MVNQAVLCGTTVSVEHVLKPLCQSVTTLTPENYIITTCFSFLDTHSKY